MIDREQYTPGLAHGAQVREEAHLCGPKIVVCGSRSEQLVRPPGTVRTRLLCK
jgi:hypothetical protein